MDILVLLGLPVMLLFSAFSLIVVFRSFSVVVVFFRAGSSSGVLRYLPAAVPDSSSGALLKT